MTGIIIPGAFRSSGRPFAELCLKEDQLLAVANGFIRILRDSFAEDARRQGKRLDQMKVSESEKKRRSEIMADWFRRLRGDLHLSIPRCLDETARALRAHLDSQTYTPPVERKLWVPETTGARL